MIQFAESSHPTTLVEAVRFFADPENCDSYIKGIRWPDGMKCCPKCGSTAVGEIRSRGKWQCREKGCRKQFSLTVGTIMEASHLRLDQWLVAVWMIVNCRNGVSSCEIARAIDCKQQSAWHLLHRIRAILAQEGDGQFTGTVEADETYVGGLFKFMSEERRERARQKGRKGKAVVHAIKERRSGKVRAEVIPEDASGTAREIVVRNVKKGSRLYTDEGAAYKWASESWYQHESVNHKREYVRGKVHTNGCENFFNCLRRGVKGTYIKPTAEHLQAYVDEAVFRFNVRLESEWTRFNSAVRMIVGKRLTYSELTDGAKR